VGQGFFAPGGTGWLIRHELRLSWRQLTLRDGGNRRLIISLVVVGLVALGFGAMGGFASRLLTPAAMPKAWPYLVAVIDAGLFFIVTLMLAQSLSTATIVFYDRGDLDLLLTAPLPPGRMLTVRMLAMAVNAMWGFLAFLSPLVLFSAVIGGHWNWLAGLVVIVGLSVMMTAIGVGCAMGLVRLIGPRRTRTLAQVIGALVGAGIMIITQAGNFFGRSRASIVYGDILGWMEKGQGGAWLVWPARAVVGEPVPLLSFLAAAVLLFVFLAWFLGRGFAENAAAAAGAAERVRQVRSRSGPPAPFKAGLMRVMIGKELKLVFRDPTLISQVLLQVLYVGAVTFSLARSMGSNQGGIGQAILMPVSAGGLTFLSGQISAGLGWLTISAEDSPELLLCAPITQVQAAQAKVAAVALPIIGIVLIPAILIARFNLWAGLCALAGSCACAIAMGFIELWNQKPAKRSQFRMRRRGTGSSWVYFVEMIINIMVALAVGLVASAQFWAVIPAALALAGIFAMKKDKWLNA
jgi:ABC-2 type transport system permease protein